MPRSANRENINPNPSLRQMEVYNDFSGGVNSETSNEKLKINEFPIFDNVDLNGRGSARRRYGRLPALTTYPSGTAQGMFLYHRSGQTNPDVVMAASGQLYLVYGSQPLVSRESATGTVDGVNGTFTVSHKYLADNTNFKVEYVPGPHKYAQYIYIEDPKNPPVATPVSSQEGTAGLPEGLYTIGYSYTCSYNSGETKLSPTASVYVKQGQTIRVEPVTSPDFVTGVNFYVSYEPNNTSVTLLESQTVDTVVEAVTHTTNPIFISSPASSTAAAPSASNTATQFTVDFANGVITFPNPSIMSIGGGLYVTYNYEMIQLPITNLSGGFQTTRSVSAVQYGTVLYIATGTQLCQYDGTTASTVTPYTPTSMEAIWIGTNGLAANPSGYLTDGTQSTGISVAGIIPANNKPSKGAAVNLTAYVNVASTITAEDYLWEWRYSPSPSIPNPTWTTLVNWAGNTSGANKTISWTPDTATNYDIRVTARDANNTTTVSTPYVLTNFQVYETPQPAKLNVGGIQTCNLISLYWDRFVLAGDTSNPTQMYISDVTNPAYFPVDSAINWDTGKREPIQAMVMFRNYMFVFCTTSIQALEGETPDNYKKTLIHPEYGTIAGRSVQVVNNMVFFLSAEGIMFLQPNLYMTYYNVVRADYPIRTTVASMYDTNACSMFYDNQYWIAFPSSSVMYRFYFDYNAWVRDTSPVMNLNQMLHYGAQVYNLTTDCKLMKLDRNTFNDIGNVYTMKVKSRYFDFEEIFNYKKLKNLFVLAQHYDDHAVQFAVTVEADAAITLTPDLGVALVDNNHNVMWVTSTVPNFTFYNGTALGAWVLGQTALGNLQLSVQRTGISGSKTRRIRVTFEHTQDSNCELFGFGFEFRIKRPY